MQQEVLLRLNMSIYANKLLQSKMPLVNKHAMLTIATLNVSEGNIQNVVKFFGLHPRLIRATKVHNLCHFLVDYSNQGEPNKFNLIHKITPIDELIAYLKPKLQYFMHHNFVANWQDM
jgi:hypothetical protein